MHLLPRYIFTGFALILAFGWMSGTISWHPFVAVVMLLAFLLIDHPMIKWGAFSGALAMLAGWWGGFYGHGSALVEAFL